MVNIDPVNSDLDQSKMALGPLVNDTVSNLEF